MQRSHFPRVILLTTALLCNGALIDASDAQRNPFPTNPALLSFPQTLIVERYITTFLNSSDLEMEFNKLKLEALSDCFDYHRALMLFSNSVQEKIDVETKECNKLLTYLYFEVLGAILCPFTVYSCSKELAHPSTYDETSKWKWLHVFYKAYTAKQNLDGVVYGTIGALALPVLIKLTFDERNSHKEQLEKLTMFHKQLQKELELSLRIESLEFQELNPVPA